MDRVKRIVYRLAIALSVLPAMTARAEIADLRGQTSSVIVELREGTEGQRNEVQDAFPSTSDTLPLQVVAQVVELGEDAGAFATAQLADPLPSTTTNPAELARGLTLNSVSPDLAYTGHATTDEIRLVRLTRAELGRAAGATAPLTGRLFLDGVFAVFAETGVVDLSGAEVTIHVVVEQLFDPNAYLLPPDPNDPNAVVDPNSIGSLFDPNEPRDPNLPADPDSVRVVFDGQLAVQGRSDGGVDVVASGDFPTSAILRVDLPGIAPELGTFTLVTVPNVTLDYDYRAIVDEPFGLRARLTVEGTNRPDGVGVLGLMGFPITGWTDVIQFTQPPDLSAKVISTVERQRTDPSGEPAFPPTVPFLPLSACGLLGFEPLVALGLLVGLRGTRLVRPRPRK